MPLRQRQEVQEMLRGLQIRGNNMFSGVFYVKVDHDGYIVFPEEWRHLVAKDRTFYFAPTHCNDTFDLTPQRLYDAEVGLLAALSTEKGMGDITLAYRSESFKVVVEEDWRMRVPKTVLDAVGAKDTITLVGGVRKILVS